jgi:transcriptional regulator with XRE-family HTH domain
MVTREQCRVARGLLGWSQAELAEAALIGIVTVRQFETGAHEPRRLTLHAIRRAFESAGVEFIDENGGRPGVRLRKGHGSIGAKSKSRCALPLSIRNAPRSRFCAVTGEDEPVVSTSRRTASAIVVRPAAPTTTMSAPLSALQGSSNQRRDVALVHDIIKQRLGIAVVERLPAFNLRRHSDGQLPFESRPITAGRRIESEGRLLAKFSSSFSPSSLVMPYVGGGLGFREHRRADRAERRN